MMRAAVVAWLARRPMALSLALLALLCGALASTARAQELDFHPPAAPRDAQAAAVMRDLAQRVLPVYQEKRPERYLGYLSALQLVAGDYAAADATRASLARRRGAPDAVPAPSAAALYDIYVHARAVEAHDHTGFEAAFTQAYREALGHMSDLDAYAVTGLAPVAPASLEAALQAAFEAHRGRASLTLSEAVELVWTYFSFDAYRRLGSLAEALGAEDERRRYAVDERAVVRTPDGARLAVLVVRPRAAAQPRPALLEFTVHPGSRSVARECAAHGYVGVVAYARGVGRSSGAMLPFERDGADAEAVIDWIAHQAWSDGRVGMVGEGYSGFTAWAAARRAPAALKAIATTDAMAPGISFPMSGSIFQNTAFEWLSRVSRAGGPDRAAAEDPARWRALYRSLYVNGDPSGDLDGLLGQPSAILHRWLDHPAYDAYWQAMIPYREQFARIDIPVLSTSGYYADGAVGTLYYFQEHQRFLPAANHTLVLGPYGDGGDPDAPRGAAHAEALESPAGPQAAFPADPGAAVPLRELRYQWFDFVLRGGPRPPLLQDRVNYEVTGADAWHHAPTIAAMSDATLRLYLERAASGETHRLADKPGAENAYVRQTVDLADRRDADVAPGGNTPRDAVVFVSDPLPQPVEVGGLFSAHLDLLVNKRDVDLTFALYERLASGESVRLYEPAYAVRASQAGDRSRRHLLAAGVRQPLDLVSERIASRRLQAGSRLMMVLGVNKRPDQEINLGTGRNVRDEYIEFAGPPLDIRWYGGSYIELPVRR